jgi:inosine-uridine nucleoside N-ribohydrolase/phospholipase/lecithinase/hemolysin
MIEAMENPENSIHRTIETFDTDAPTSLIFDDDGSQDGMTALAYMLENPKFDLQAITISQGIARPEIFADNIAKMLTRTEDPDIPIGIGRSTPLSGNNEFPDFIRDGSDTFWSPFVTLPEEADPSIEIRESAVDLIIETINNSPEPVAILATGPLTNIAEALRVDPSIVDNIEVVQIMGGAVFVEGNLPVLPDPPFSTNLEAEFNIWVDPVAAQEVFDFGELGLNIQLTPLDATNQVEFDREDYDAWLETGTPESLIAAEFLDFALTVIQSDLDPNPVWDLVAAINLSEPDFSPETPLHIDVDTESDPGDTQGDTVAVADLPPNVLVSLDPSFDNIDFDASEVFSALDETELPTVSFNVDKTVIVEGGDPQLLTFNLSQPAPAGGLEVNLLVDDPDGDSGPGDTNFPPELISNITDFGQVEVDGVITASLTIAEGATVATFGVAAFEDDLVEVGETYSFTLLEDENYIVDSASTTITTTIKDSDFMKPIVTLLPETVVTTEGDSLAWNFSLDQPVPSGGLTLNVVITQNTEPTPGDASFNVEASSNVTNVDFLFGDNESLLGFTVTLAEGVTEATLVADTAVDDMQETDEISTNTLADGEDYRANQNQNEIDIIFTDRTVVTLTPEQVNVTEGETFAWNFSLNRPAPEGGLTLSLPVTLNNDPAPGDVIYNVEGSTNIEDFAFVTQDDVSVGFTLTMPEGETEATLVSEAVIDDIAEFDEIFTTVLADGLDYVANPVSNQVVTTIAEDGVAPPSSTPVVSITPSELISTEGDTFAWDITLDQPVPSGGLTLNLPITQNNDPAPGDVIYNVDGSIGITDFDFIVEDDISIGFSVTLEEGITSATLVSETVADEDLDDSADEIFTTVLADGVDYRANPDSNEVETVLTRETVVSFTPEQVSAVEGDTFAWNFSLNQPAPEGGLTLTLPITFNNDPEPGDVIYNVEGSENITDFSFLVVDDISLGFNVTIAEGETSATLVSQAVADDLEEIDEIFTTILNDGENYRANPVSREVVTTIVEPDSSATPTVSLTPATVTATEGETFAWNFSLDQPAPSGGLSLFLPITENSDPAPGDVEYFVEGSNNISDFEFVTTSSISQIYAFGDSYSDDGLSFEISTDAVEAGVEGSFILPADPELGLYDDEGRWTNGPTAVEVLSDTLDVELTDYAVGGAKSGAGNYYSWLDSFQDTGVFGQIDQFSMELSAASADPDALYFIFASANDLFEYADFGLPGTVEELAAQTVENIVAGVTDLSELGAEQFLVVNSSDLDILPGVIEFGQVEEATVFTDEVNELLPEALAAISQELGVEIALYDHVAISDEIRANPADFGLTNVDDPYQPVFPPEEPPADAQPDEYYFWDEYHPTARTHEIIGEDMASFVGSEFEDDDVSVGFNVTIAEGATEASLVSEVIVDDIEEGNETFTTVIAESENYSVDPDQNQVVTNLLDTGDSSTMTTVSISPNTLIATEGETFAWDFSLDQPAPESGLSIFLPVTFNNDPAPGDVDYFVDGSTGITDFEFVVDDGVSIGFNLTIAEGETSATLVSEAVVDDIAESDEIFTTVIADGVNYQADPTQNQVTTILTEVPVVSLVTEEVTAAEGETFAWDFSLNQPAPESGLSLFLPVTFNNDPAPGDVEYFIDGSTGITDFEFVVEDGVSIGFDLTIAEGETSATLVSEVVVDDIAEGEEIFTTVIADGVDYRANPAQNQVVTNIPGDDSVELPTVSLSVDPEAVSENNEQYTLTLNLSQAAPEGGLEVIFSETDSDNAFGDIEFTPVLTNASDFESLDPVGDELVRSAVTINEGATTASLTFQTIPDGLTEGDETTTFNLISNEGYVVDSNSQVDIVTILDTSIGDLVGDEGDNVLEGTDGDNLIAGGFGNDEILGGDGDDVLRGDLNSRSSGGTVGGNDTISGGAGNDSIGGKAGDDQLFGDEGDDIIFGDDGDDLIRGGLGNDLLYGDDFSGGSGADTFVLAAGEGTDTILDFEVGTDIIGLADGLTAEDLTVTTASGSTTIALGDETLAILEGVVSASEIDYAMF